MLDPAKELNSSELMDYKDLVNRLSEDLDTFYYHWLDRLKIQDYGGDDLCQSVYQLRRELETGILFKGPFEPFDD